MSIKTLILVIIISMLSAIAMLFSFIHFFILISGGGQLFYHTVLDPIRDSYILTGNVKALVLMIVLVILWLLAYFVFVNDWFNSVPNIFQDFPKIIITILRFCVFITFLHLAIVPASLVGEGIIYDHALKLVQDHEGTVSLTGEKGYQILEYTWLPLQEDKLYIFREDLEDIPVFMAKDRNISRFIKGERITDDISDLSSNLYIIYDLTKQPKLIKITPSMIKKDARVITADESDKYCAREVLTVFEWPYIFYLKQIIKEEGIKPIFLGG